MRAASTPSVTAKRSRFARNRMSSAGSRIGAATLCWQNRRSRQERNMTHKSKLFYVGVALCLFTAAPAFGVSREIVQLQTQVQALQDSMARMQQAFDERMGVMKNLIDQSTDNINKMTAAVEALQKN